MSSDSNKPPQVTAEDSLEKNEDKTNGNGEMNAMVNTLRNNIEGMQNSFRAVYSTLAVNLKQSLEMIQVMNSIMEQLLLSNIKIDVQADSNPRLLTIIISNSCQFPIPKVSCSLVFKKKDDDKDANVKFECVESIIREVKKSNNLGSKPSSPLSIFVQNSCIGSSDSDASFTLSPQTQIIEKLMLIPSEFAQ
ncbi:7018_t:CDS:2, partial [Scutellospora calospora]